MPLPEKALIRRIRTLARGRALPRKKAVTLTGIGDDSAVLRLPPGHEAVVTTDFSLEGTHFRREWHPAESVGHRCLARGLSDIAAVGGSPIAAFLSLALPEALPQKWVDSFLAGFLRLGRHFRVVLAGGDLAESHGGILADVTVLGSCPAGKAVLRSGARPGDSIYVTGELGRSAAVLEQLRSHLEVKIRAREQRAHYFPHPRIEIGLWLREHRLVTAMIDVSDGLSTDLTHICEQSRVGAVIGEYSIPRPSNLKTSGLHFALHGGDDYELLFTAPASARLPAKIAGVRISRIGEITKYRKLWLADSHGQRKPLLPHGWEHFG